jgi:hypothetical protein
VLARTHAVGSKLKSKIRSVIRDARRSTADGALSRSSSSSMIINIRRHSRLRWCIAVAALGLLSASSAQAEQSWLYEVVIETGMPNLEENLRYATTKSTHCFNDSELAHSFSAMRHDALRGCELEHASHLSDGSSYALTCKGSTETHGNATWSVTPDRKVGTLRVKLGGKNMTFFQRVSARVLGACE